MTTRKNSQKSSNTEIKSLDQGLDLVFQVQADIWAKLLIPAPKLLFLKISVKSYKNHNLRIHHFGAPKNSDG